MTATLSPYTVHLPPRLASAPAPEHAPVMVVFVRRRLLVSMAFIAVVVALWAGAGSVLANRGGAPASTSAVRPATPYVVHAGDTMWSIAQHFRGQASQVGYVDALIAVNGGSSLQVGQVLTLP